MEELTQQLNEVFAQVIAYLIMTLLTAFVGLAAWAAKALRDYLTTRNLIGLRTILDNTIERAKLAFPMESAEAASAVSADRLADYLTAYVTKTIPGTLDKIGVKEGALRERMAKEAAAMIEFARRGDYSGRATLGEL